jgi:hypothetical protein
MLKLCSSSQYAASQTQEGGPPKEERKKPPGEVIRYTAEFLMKFSEVNASFYWACMHKWSLEHRALCYQATWLAM